MRCPWRHALAAALLAALGACSTLPSPVPGEAPTSGAPGARPAARSGGKPAAQAPARAEAPMQAEPDEAAQGEGLGSALQLDKDLPEFQRGTASWYGLQFHGRRTASGERFDMNGFSAAHRTLPFGTLVRVRSLVNGREVDVRINDRGPHVAGRIIDLSRGAAEALGMLGMGMKSVTLTVVGEAAEPAEQARFTARPRARAKAPQRRKAVRSAPGRP